ncbi:MAG TPA: hypothetical protein PKD72_04840 [Gemmatales bacterium]|nr:hypothetical protein [Gemmatales bacterium]
MHVFGPVLQYDLVTTARKSRYFAMRFFYAALLFLVLYIFYAVKLEGSDVGRVARQKLIDFAEVFSYTYLIIADTRLCGNGDRRGKGETHSRIPHGDRLEKS